MLAPWDYGSTLALWQHLGTMVAPWDYGSTLALWQHLSTSYAMLSNTSPLCPRSFFSYFIFLFS